MQIRVSVVIPFYNVADYLPECVESVLAQSLPGVEAILVDDGSDDGSEKLADEYAKKYSDRVKVIHQKNMGAAVARNAGFDIAEGDYIHFLDSDDRLKKNAMQVLVDEAGSKDLDILFFSAEVFSTDPLLADDVIAHKDEFIIRSDTGKVMGGRESLLKFYETTKNEYPVAAWRRLYRKSFLDECGVRFPDGVIHEDEHFGFFTQYYAKRLEQIGEILLERRLRRDSVMYSKKLMDSVLGYKCVYLKLIDFIEQTDLSDEDRKLMITHSERHIFHTILFYLQADEEERRKCRPEIETYLERARKYREYYTKPVQRGISFFDGELPEDEVKLPAFPFLCYE